MVKPIVKDVLFLKQKSVEATEEDKQIIAEMHDTLRAHKDHCVGMAANMIGYRKRIIIVSMGFVDVVMINPVILQKEDPYPAEEGCLSLQGTRSCTRYRKIRVSFLNESFQKVTQDYEGMIAQIVQHECDHLEGIVI